MDFFLDDDFEFHFLYFKGIEDPRYTDSVCYQRFCCKIEFAVIEKLE